MYRKKCFCGDSEKNFMIDIGPAFMAQCCKDKGYDVNGNPPQAKTEKPEPPKENPADVNGDGKVDEKDLSEVHKAYSEEKATKKKTRRRRTKKS